MQRASQPSGFTGKLFSPFQAVRPSEVSRELCSETSRGASGQQQRSPVPKAANLDGGALMAAPVPTWERQTSPLLRCHPRIGPLNRPGSRGAEHTVRSLFTTGGAFVWAFPPPPPRAAGPPPPPGPRVPLPSPGRDGRFSLSGIRHTWLRALPRTSASN